MSDGTQTAVTVDEVIIPPLTVPSLPSPDVNALRRVLRDIAGMDIEARIADRDLLEASLVAYAVNRNLQIDLESALARYLDFELTPRGLGERYEEIVAPTSGWIIWREQVEDILRDVVGLDDETARRYVLAHVKKNHTALPVVGEDAEKILSRLDLFGLTTLRRDVYLQRVKGLYISAFVLNAIDA